MQVGAVVRYKDNPSIIGLVIDRRSLGEAYTVLVQWNDGTRQWRHTSILEDICE